MTWWHLEVLNVRRPGAWNWVLETREAERCLVDFAFTPVYGGATVSKSDGVWSSDDGPPRTELTLRPGDRIAKIPVVVRTTQGGTLMDTGVDPNVTYITGVQFLRHHVGHERLDPGEYELKVSIRSGDKVWSTARFLLRNPPSGLSGFMLQEYSL
jgi:hypothetical protein